MTNQAGSEVHGLSRGHISIRGPEGIATSKDRIPNQSMFIFLSIVDLLDGITELFAGKRQYRFVGNDCSFEFAIRRTDRGSFQIVSQKRVIVTASQNVIVASLWAGVSAFLDRYQQKLDSGDPVYGDLLSSVAEFRLAFDF